MRQEIQSIDSHNLYVHVNLVAPTSRSGWGKGASSPPPSELFASVLRGGEGREGTGAWQDAALPMGSPQIEGGQEHLLPSQSKPTCTPHQSPVGLPPGKSLFPVNYTRSTWRPTNRGERQQLFRVGGGRRTNIAACKLYRASTGRHDLCSNFGVASHLVASAPYRSLGKSNRWCSCGRGLACAPSSRRAAGPRFC